MTGDPVATARTASDALRTLAHQLNGDRVDATQVYDLLGELAQAASRFPHLLDRLDATLTSAAHDGDLVDIDHVGRQHDPALLLAAIGTHLAAAEQAAHALTNAIDTVHEHAATLARSGRCQLRPPPTPRVRTVPATPAAG